MNRTIALLILPFFTGCGIVNLNPTTWFADEEMNPPVELQNIDEEVELRRIWSASIGNGQGSDYFELTPAIDGERIFAASEDGNIYGLELDSGDVIWRTRLDDETVTGGVGAGRGLVLVGTANAEVIAFNQF
ncbi:MAG: PQQ-binding-like beta-propeller repeat protein, partial [Gammaproteobacteria bacterium]|nr:PQQ-binding-like beta-propeller repeat protein [Gammaproteobacteria bacterium]